MLYLHVYLCISSSILSLFFFPSLEEYERAEEELCEEERWKSLYKVIEADNIVSITKLEMFSIVNVNMPFPNYECIE